MNDNDLSSGFVTELSVTQEVNTELKKIHTSTSGFNELWEMRRLGKLHVLKSLQPLYINDPLYEKLLQKEFDIAYKLEHTHICRTLGLEKHKVAGNCILMEYIDGETLEDFMQSGKLTLALAHKFIQEICDALQYIHSKQIIHRDLKPANILITHNGYNVKLIDFGLSDCDDYHILKIPAGTRHYIAPEQLKGEVKPDARADIYSLGVIIAEMEALLHNKQLNNIARKCMRPHREARYATATEVKEALKEKNNRRSIATTITIVSAVAATLFVYFGSKVGSTPPDTFLSAPVYTNSVMSTLYQETLLTEKASLQYKTDSPNRAEEQLKADSIQLWNSLLSALNQDFPLAKQRETTTYRILLQELQQTVASEIATIRAK